MQLAQGSAQDALAEAEARRDTVVVSVATPIPTPVVGSDQIVLNFGVNMFTPDIPNRDRWNDVIDQFIAENPRIGNIELAPPSFTLDGPTTDEYDCYFQLGNPIANPNFDLSSVLNLDPFMDADPTFDPNDFIGSSLQQVQRNGMTLGYPMVMQPDVLWVHNTRFEEAGLPLPTNNWSIESFVEALDTLQFFIIDDEAVFQPPDANGNYLPMLAAAFGGIPYDYRADPPALNMTDPASINGLRQALDLAIAGYIDYSRLDLFNASGTFGSEGLSPIVSDTLNQFSNRLNGRMEGNGFYADWSLTNYPSGEFAPVAYQLGVAVINATAQDPEACYDWLRTITQNPDLLIGIPVTHSAINDPIVATAQGEDMAALYRNYAELLSSPNVVELPGGFGGAVTSTPGTWLERTWIYDIYNGYILDGGDLETLMAQAQQNIMTYRECISGFEQIDFGSSSQDEILDWNRQFTDCAISVDPSLEGSFPWLDS